MNATPDELDEAADVEEAEGEDAGLTPWVSLTPEGLMNVRVRAGYVNGDGQWEALPIDATVDVEQGQQVAALAVEWYRRTVTDVVQRAAAAQADEEGD